jgi:Coenzyme PQQ synthesis protein D (PqqD)
MHVLAGSADNRAQIFMEIIPTKKIVVPPDVLVNVIDGESVLLNLKSECYFGLDEVGTRMWQVLSESASVKLAYEALLKEYDVEPEQLQRDLENLIDQLVEHGLVATTDD